MMPEHLSDSMNKRVFRAAGNAAGGDPPGSGHDGEVVLEAGLLALVESFDRRGTEPFELFRSEFGQRCVRIQ